MTRGPKINYTKRNFTTRDNLGINAAGASFQAELCPVINTVTPRAFYWIFAVWNYYDYWQNYKTSNRGYSDFEKNFLKRNDYYFVLASLLTPGSDRNNLVGYTNCAEDLANNPDGPYPFNRNYFISSYGGMQYYMPGCETLGFVTSVDSEGNPFPFAKITEKKGLPLAVAFENIIKDTEYYKSYRLQTKPVPRAALEELGQTISLKMEGMAECKKLLSDSFFLPTRNALFDNHNLILTKDYLTFITHHFNQNDFTAAQMRRVLFDCFSTVEADNQVLPSELKEISTAWEVAIGRQYFTLCIELIWKYMLMELTVPMDLATWINTCIAQAKWTINLQDSIDSLLPFADFGFDVREKMLAEGSRSSKNVTQNLETALKVLLSLYNRFSGRADIAEEYLLIGENISIAELNHWINNHKGSPILELLVFIMGNWVVKRHETIAFKKMLDGRDGFFVERIDGQYYQRFIAGADYTGNRMLQLLQVMKDLNLVGE